MRVYLSVNCQLLHVGSCKRWRGLFHLLGLFESCRCICFMTRILWGRTWFAAGLLLQSMTPSTSTMTRQCAKIHGLAACNSILSFFPRYAAAQPGSWTQQNAQDIIAAAYYWSCPPIMNTPSSIRHYGEVPERLALKRVMLKRAQHMHACIHTHKYNIRIWIHMSKRICMLIRAGMLQVAHGRSQGRGHHLDTRPHS